MDVKGYITEIIKAPIPSLMSLDDEVYLIRILQGKNSAYKIYSYENSEGHKTKGFKIAYKNVHKRVQKLLNYGLIEEVIIPGGFKHGAKNYMLKTRGLVYICSELLAPRDFSNVISSHQDDIIFKTFLDPFLERRTIKNATYTLMRLISNYIIECCQITKYCLMLSVPYREENEMLPESDLFSTTPINYMYYRLISCIESFFVRLAILNEEIEDWDNYVINKGWTRDAFPSKGKIFCLSKDKQETQRLIARDKKFMNTLRSVHDKFRVGFTTLADLD